ncbi:restriction endonuclease subunit S [Exiguobacterium acetylicum]|uniref:restriction endonuclease subunit S n=1 Tax=Exiguobacterium acetylicum TaxID=41170 RepID=UPI0011ECDEDA|nr:restriction endonuclease subunit S [Exiguobacterium acetylicum]
MEFKEISLDDIVESYIDNRGKTCPTVEEEDSYLPLIATNCITDDLYPTFKKVRHVNKETYDNWFRGHPQANDIIFVNKGTPGGTALVPEKVNFCFAQDMVGLRIKKEYDPKYIFAVLRSSLIRQRIESMQVGTMIPHFKKGDFKKLNLPIALNNRFQKEVGRIHYNILDKIKINKSTIENLEHLGQTLFKQWIVDFEFLNNNDEPYQSSGGKMEDSDLGLIPVGWEVKSLDEIANYQNGLAMQKFRPLGDAESLPVLKIKELNQGYVDNNSDRCSLDIKEPVKVYDGDVIFSWSGTLLTKLWVGGNAGLNQHLFKVTSNQFPKWFYYFWTKYHLNNFIAIAADKATTMGHIKKSHLTASKVIIPDSSRLKDFSVVMELIVEEIISKGIEIKKLKELRDTLIPKLLSGNIDMSSQKEVNDHVSIS